MVDVLLIYPIWPTLGGRGKLQKMLPPLGILSIASYLEENNFKVALIDLHSEQYSIEEFRAKIKKLNPKFIGMTVLSAHLKVALNIANVFYEELPEAKIIAGGVHAEIYPEQLLTHKPFDAVCVGDGEEVMLEYVMNKPKNEINGLVYIEDGRLVKNKVRPIEMNLDKYPFPAYHLINMDNYFPAFTTYKRLPAINLLMTRGCPGKCSFCNSARTVLRGRTPEKMVELIKILRYEYGILQFTFYDDTFTAHKKNLIKFCELMIEQKVDASWVCYARGDMFTEEIAELISKAGCHHLLLGIETGSEKLMKEIGKSIDKSKYHKVVKIAHKYNLEVRGAFILGHQKETLETMKETLQFAIDLDLDFYQPSIMTPYPGTQLYIDSKVNDLLTHQEYELYGQNEVILKMDNLSSAELLKFLRYSYFRFYLRPKSIYRQLKKLKSLRHLKDLIYAVYLVLFDKVLKGTNKDLMEWMNYLPKETSKRPLDYVKTSTPPLTYMVRKEASNI